MQALRQQVLRREKLKIRFKFHLACLAGNNIAICPNSTELAKELSRRSLSLMKKAREEKEMRKRALLYLRLGLAEEVIPKKGIFDRWEWIQLMQQRSLA